MHILFINWDNVKQNLLESSILIRKYVVVFFFFFYNFLFVNSIKARRFTIHTYARTKCYVLSPAYLYTPTRAYVNICIRTHVPVYTYICTYIHTHTHIVYIYIHTHTTHTHTHVSINYFFFLKLCAYARVWIVHHNERTFTHILLYRMIRPRISVTIKVLSRYESFIFLFVPFILLKIYSH